MGRLGTLIQQSTLDLNDRMRVIRAEMAEVIDSNADGSPAKISQQIGTLLQERRGDDDLTSLISLPAAKAEIGGRMMVKMHETGVVKELRRFQQQAGLAFLQMPWPEAMAALRQRGQGIVREQELSTLLAQFRRRGDQATRLMLEHIQRRMEKLLDDAMEEGINFREFAEQVEDLTSDLDLPGPSTNYTEMVFRTNLQTAYGAGRFRAMSDPDVIEAQPYWEYRTAGDDRVRPSHALLHGMFFRVGNPATDPLFPPNGYSDRCTGVSRSREEGRGKRIHESLPSGAEIHPRFASAPPTLVDADI